MKDIYDNVCLCVVKSNEDFFKKLIVDYPEILNYQDEDGCTILMCACVSRNKNIVSLILNLSPNLELCDKHGRTALAMTLKHDDASIASMLIKNGADTNVKHKDGSHIIEHAIHKSSLEFIKLLVDNGSTLDGLSFDKEYQIGSKFMEKFPNNEHYDYIMLKLFRKSYKETLRIRAQLEFFL